MEEALALIWSLVSRQETKVCKLILSSFGLSKRKVKGGKSGGSRLGATGGMLNPLLSSELNSKIILKFRIIGYIMTTQW